MIDIMKQYNIQNNIIRLLHPQERYVWELSYWKYQWCAGIVLANVLSDLDGTNKTLLEIGPGLGLCTTIAGMQNFNVTVVDKMLDSLEYTTKNAIANGVLPPRCIHQTWAEFLKTNTIVFDTIIAGDTLYDINQIPILIELFKTAIKPTGIIYMTDPFREPNLIYNRFIEQLLENGFEYTIELMKSKTPPEAPNAYDNDEVRLLTITPNLTTLRP